MAADPSQPTADGTSDDHRATTVENGSFCTARCACGWSGPARRSRDRARRDAGEHVDLLSGRRPIP